MAEEEPRLHWHWQNLNEDRDGKVKGTGLRHGRAWLHFGTQQALEVEWRTPSASCRAEFRVSTDSEDTVSISVALPPVSLHFGLESWTLGRWIAERTGGRYGYRRELSLRVVDWAIWWCLWRDSNEWHSGDRRQGAWHPFGHPGSRVGEPDVRETREVLVPMPEGAYKATARREVSTIRRRLFPMLQERISVVELDFGKTPVPVPGKGENSWDCGEDAISSSSGPAETVEQRIGEFVGDALRTRKRYGGSNWRPEAKKAPEAAE